MQTHNQLVTCLTVVGNEFVWSGLFSRLALFLPSRALLLPPRP